jgi:hypothetical protein
MLGIAKQALLQGLERFGYVLLKKDAHQDLMARAAGPAPSSPPPPAPAPSPVAPVPVAAPVVAAPPPWPVAPPGLFPFAAESEFTAFRRQLPSTLDLPEQRILALFSAAQYLVAQRVAGDVVDCTHAADKVLAVLAAALVFLRDTSRRVILFDPTADPHHRAERALESWGNDFELIGDKRRPARLLPREPAPDIVRATGYPEDKLLVRRYPREPIAASDPVAYVGLTTETYPANRMTVAAFLAKLVPGGVLTVDRISRSDAVGDHLAAAKVALSPSDVAENYLMAIRK